MRFGLLTALIALLALGVAGTTETTTSRTAAVKRPTTVLAIRGMGRGATELRRVDRRTFAPVGNRAVPLGAINGAWALSPDGRQLAVGVEDALGLRIVDVNRMRALADVKTRNGQISVAAWLTPRRIVGVEETGLFVVDPSERRLLHSQPLEEHPIGVGRTSDELALLLSPRDKIGATRLALVDAEGRSRSVVLDRIVAGWRYQVEADAPMGESWQPGLAVDSAAGRAFVVGGGSPVAEIDLASLTVRYHDLARPASLLGRLRNWLEPQAHAKGPVAGSWRTVRWLGGGSLAFTGEDGRVVGPGQVETKAAALTLVDTRSWSARTLEQRANGIAFVGGTLLATLHDPFERGAGVGLLGFNRDGSKRFHLFGAQQVGLMSSIDDRVVVDAIGGPRVVNVRSGRVARVTRVLPQLLTGSMQRY
jgi:hypothetical protein